MDSIHCYIYHTIRISPKEIENKSNDDIAGDDNALIHPDKEHSTELGEVPQSTDQGSIRQGMVRDPYSLSYLYTI